MTTSTATVTLPADTQILITRRFAASRHQVYRAWTEPELIRRWWHANRAEVTEVQVDLRVGGRWRYAARTPDGFEFAFYGEYREIVPDAKLVTTEIYQHAPDDPALTTATFAAHGDGTMLTLLFEHASQAARDAQLQSGMEDGLQDALSLLEELAGSLS
ncbi:MAG TPA: SRPBCC family protein [Jatrophihabitans sp.]|nr:SRPBCC family protein [Jatrophihabitans sp.]